MTAYFGLKYWVMDQVILSCDADARVAVHADGLPFCSIQNASRHYIGVAVGAARNIYYIWQIGGASKAKVENWITPPGVSLTHVEFSLWSSIDEKLGLGVGDDVDNAIDWLKQRHDWAGLNSIAAVECQRINGEKKSTEIRYFISSHDGRCAREIANFVRNHWRVENNLHWTLDVCFNEDSCRTRTQYAAENLARVRRIALTLLKNEKTCVLGVKSKRAKAAYDRDYRLTVLGLGQTK